MKALNTAAKRHRLRVFTLISVVGLFILLAWASGSWAQSPIPHAGSEAYGEPGEFQDCLACHQAGVNGAQQLAGDHLGRANEDCLICHKYTGALPSLIPHLVEGQEDCWECHENGVGTAGPLAGDHVEYSNEECLDCHRVSPGVPTPAPALPEPTPESGQGDVEVPGSYADCADCHQVVSMDDRHTEIVGLSPGDLNEGQRLFGEYCARCHGENGEQAVQTEAGEEIILNSLEYQSQQDIAGMIVGIAIGAGERMPAFGPEDGGPLSWDQVRSLASFVRAWGPHAIIGPIAGDAVYGAELYAEHCAACHGSEGQGGPAAGDPINTAEYLSGITNDALRQVILEGVSGMPGYASRLTDEFVDDLIAFIRSWQQ